MSRPRASIAGLMGATGLAAAGLAALRNPTDAWVGVVIGLAIFAPAAGIVVGACREAPRHGRFWAGCALACWSYLALASTRGPGLPTTALLDALRPWTEPQFGILKCPDDDTVVPGPGALSYVVSGHHPWTTAPWGPPPGQERFRRVGHGLIALLVGVLGGLVAGRLGASRRNSAHRKLIEESP